MSESAGQSPVYLEQIFRVSFIYTMDDCRVRVIELVWDKPINLLPTAEVIAKLEEKIMQLSHQRQVKIIAVMPIIYPPRTLTINNLPRGVYVLPADEFVAPIERSVANEPVRAAENLIGKCLPGEHCKREGAPCPPNICLYQEEISAEENNNA